jgi:hypothetical protein
MVYVAKEKAVMYLIPFQHWPKQVRYAWLEFLGNKSTGGALFAKPFQSMHEKATFREFIPYLAWYFIRHGHSKFKQVIQGKQS